MVPLDEELTYEAGESVYKFEESFELQLADYFRIDTRVGYKLNGRKALHEIALDLTNITNRPNEYAHQYNPYTKQIEMRYQQGFFFILYYRIRF